MKWFGRIKDMFYHKWNNKVEINETARSINQVGTIPIDFNLRALVVSDGHGCLTDCDFPICDIDVCFLLGDLSLRDIEIVKEKIGETPIYGVLGNHDGFELYDRCGIENIHGRVIEINGVKIAGMQGSFRYKNTNFPFYTDEESVAIAEKLPPADILISHDSPKHFHGSDDWAHSGLEGISHYCKKYNVPLNIHGHFHDSVSGILENGTRSICCYKVQLIDTKTL